jgi:hypothetical protein
LRPSEFLQYTILVSKSIKSFFQCFILFFDTKRAKPFALKTKQNSKPPHLNVTSRISDVVSIVGEDCWPSFKKCDVYFTFLVKKKPE